MMSIIHCRVHGDFLSDHKAVDIGSDLIDGATEFMSKSHREFCASIRVFGPLRRYKDRASQVFVEVGAADSAIRHLEPDFVPTTYTKPVSANAVVLMKELKSDCLQRLTGWGLCQGGCRLWRGIGVLAWSPLSIPTE